MKRDLKTLANETFNLLIIGGGIYGATLAWDAVLRGLKVALIEKGDWAGGTSSNSLKIIHGGLRYLQHADFVRMRESITERRILLHIAPHLVRPLPCVMPTYGHAIKGPEVMRIGMMMNDLFSIDRNRGLSSDRRLPNGKIISKQKFLEIMPYIKRESLNGGAIWYDAHMINSERLLLSFLHSAVEKGATAANYVEAGTPIIKNGRVTGVQVHDRLSGERFDIKARLTISAMGPWINDLLRRIDGRKEKPVAFSTAINLVLNRKFTSEFAFAAPTQKQFKDKDALINKGSRLLFFVPWRGLTLAGTAHQPYRGEAEDYRVSEAEVEDFLAEINGALPGADITREQVNHVYAGLLPMTAVNEATGDVTLQKHFQIIDHQITDGIEGLLSVLTVKYTTARGVSEAVMNGATRKLGVKTRCTSRGTKIWGGEMDHFGDFVTQTMQKMDSRLSPQSKAHLLDTYGTRYQEILKVDQQSPFGETIAPDSHILKAEILFGVREEMAQKLSDMMMRRTELGSAGKADDHYIASVADIMAAELGWTPAQKQQEIQDYIKIYQVNA
jgi:glycerol-3-phosphate dehydrogenase